MFMRKIVVAVVLIFMTSFLGCGSPGVKGSDQKKLELENQKLNKKAAEQAVEINYLNEELDAYKRFMQIIDFKALNKEKLINFAKSEWQYELKISGTDCPVTGEVELKENTFEVQLIERQAPFTALPVDIFNQGSISRPYNEHLKVVSSFVYTTSGSSGTVVDSFIYRFSKLPKESVIELNITKDLQDRLGLKTRNIKIKTL